MKRLLIIFVMNIAAHSICMDDRQIFIYMPKNEESSLNFHEKDIKKSAYTAIKKKDTIAFEDILKKNKLSPETQEDILMKVIHKSDNVSLACCLKYGFNPEGRGHDSYYLYNPLEACVKHDNAQAVKMLLQTNSYNVHKVKSSFEYAQRLKHYNCVKVFNDNK